MSRVIKFRAWDREKKEMLPTFLNLTPKSDVQKLITVQVSKLLTCELMQFTGLKDRNGKDIYEGDIVKTDGDMKPLPVIFEDGAFQLAGIGYYLNKARVSEWLVEVVGNIYESL